jgi:hypothetical protein
VQYVRRLIQPRALAINAFYAQFHAYLRTRPRMTAELAIPYRIRGFVRRNETRWLVSDQQRGCDRRDAFTTPGQPESVSSGC